MAQNECASLCNLCRLIPRNESIGKPSATALDESLQDAARMLKGSQEGIGKPSATALDKSRPKVGECSTRSSSSQASAYRQMEQDKLPAKSKADSTTAGASGLSLGAKTSVSGEREGQRKQPAKAKSDSTTTGASSHTAAKAAVTSERERYVKPPVSRTPLRNAEAAARNKRVRDAGGGTGTGNKSPPAAGSTTQDKIRPLIPYPNAGRTIAATGRPKSKSRNPTHEPNGDRKGRPDGSRGKEASTNPNQSRPATMSKASSVHSNLSLVD